jgi:hypothetical protein
MYFYTVFISENILMLIKFANGSSAVNVYLFISCLLNAAVISSVLWCRMIR